jgi:hypothetical protein
VATVNAISQPVQIKAGGAAVCRKLTTCPGALSFLLLDHFDRVRPEFHETLLVLGLIEREPNPGPGQSERLINWNRFGPLFTSPGQIFDDVYKWNTAFDGEKLLRRMEGLMRSVALPGGLYPQAETTRLLLGNTSTDLQELRFPIFQKGVTPETYCQFGITFSPAEAQGGKKAGVALLTAGAAVSC